MKIANVSFGHVDVVLPLVKNLRNRGIDVELYLCFALNRKSESILDFNDKKIETGFLSRLKTEELLDAGIKKYLNNTSFVNFFIFHNLKLRSIRNVFLSVMLAKRLKGYDIIHFNGTNGTLPLLMIMLRKKKLIFTIHDTHSHTGEKTRFNFAEKMNRYIFKSNHYVIVQNSSDYNYLNQKYPGLATKLRMIPFGILDVYREFKSAGAKPLSSDLLFFGRISRYKGIEYLIEAIKYLYNKGTRIKTIIAGDGTIYFNTAEMGEIGITLINKYLSNEELVKLIENTKIVVCPYTDATQSGVAMTAFAFNKPVIASSTGSFKDIIKERTNGMLVAPKDSYALASKIELLVSDTSALEQMEINIQKFSESGEYSWSEISSKMQSLYSSVNPGTLH
jgi:glycosyltransferase involved in cell wall biosynthesis